MHAATVSCQNNETTMQTMKHLLQADSRMRSTELGTGSVRGCGKKDIEEGEKVREYESERYKRGMQSHR